LSKLTDLQIAAICHEANRRYCIAIGDDSQPPWESAPAWQIRSAVRGVAGIRSGEITAPHASHESWMDHKFQQGWVYSEVKDPETKTHPCLVPFIELPVEQRTKDFLFFWIVRAIVSTEAE